MVWGPGGSRSRHVAATHTLPLWPQLLHCGSAVGRKPPVPVEEHAARKITAGGCCLLTREERLQEVSSDLGAKAASPSGPATFYH